MAMSAAADVAPRPIIAHVTPSIGRPAGGEAVQIHGYGFTPPVRVFFEGREALVVSGTTSRLEVITPAVTLIEPAQQLEADVMVISALGDETAQDAFTFRNEILIPRIFAALPSHGSVQGGMRVTIAGEGFQPPVLVELVAANGKTAEARVIAVDFDRIMVESPPADALGAADIRVRNIGSQSEAVLRAAFHYQPAAAITSVAPTSGPARGGTNVNINGVGLDVPVAVSIGGMSANVLRVSGTQILARTASAEILDCRDLTGPVQVIDIATGELFTGPDFTYLVQPLRIAGLAPRAVTPGSWLEIALTNANSDTVVVDLAGVVTRTVPVVDSRASLFIPQDFVFSHTACSFEGIAGTMPAPFTTQLRVTDRAACSDALALAVTIRPPQPGVCTLPPAATVVEPPAGQCLRFGRVDGPRTASIVIANRDLVGTSPLVITGIEVTGPAASDFDIIPATAPAAGTVSLQVTFRATTPGFRTATAIVRTNDPARPAIDVCLRAFLGVRRP